MQNEEIKKPNNIQDEINMSYAEYIDYLLDKYGPAKCDYFYNEHCATKNREVERLDEGLFCHHIDEEYKFGDLSDPAIAQKAPFECQKADRLVYCNYLEHLLLHVKIALADLFNEEQEWTGVDIGNAARIWKELNGFYKTGRIGLVKRRAAELIKDKYDDYVIVMNFVSHMLQAGDLYKYCTDEDLARDINGVLIHKIYNDICYEDVKLII